ncbi:MAG: protein kinase [Kiritimatiellaeota bacterium]|nr:protein kinase [Kiritimatiellota bacterium]
MNNHVQIMTEPVTVATCPKCGAMLEVPEIPAFTMVQCPTCEFEFQVPAKFGSFLLLQVLGMGGMGGVYRARDEALNREVAIKVMLKSLGDDPQFVETFQREAQAAAKLNHPNIAQIYSFGQVMGQPYIAMELIPGGSLIKMMESQGQLDPAVVFHIGAQIAEGLSEAAEANLVHGDVKPENILFDAEKSAKLVDFGLAAMQSGGPNQEVWGTPYYIAPEKVRKQKADLRSDIYSLGATLYHAIAGVPPFDGDNAADVVKARFSGDPKPLRSIRGGAVPEEVEGVVKRMLSVDPAMRYPTYGSLLGDMRRFLSKAGPVNVASSGKKIMIKGKRPKALVPAGGGALPEGMVPIAQIETEEETAREVKKRTRKLLGMGCLGCGGLVLLIAAIVGGVVWVKASRALKGVQEQLVQDTKTMAKANESIAKSVSEAKKLEERIRANIPEAEKYANDAATAVIAVLGEGVRAAMIPAEPSYDDVKASADDDAPMPPGGGKISMPPEKLEEIAKLLPPNLANDLKELDKLPPDQALAKLEEVAKALPQKEGEEMKQNLEMFKAMSEGLGGMMQQMAEGMAAAMGGAMQQMAEGMAAAMGADTEEVSAGEASYPAVKMVREMHMELYAVKKAAALAASCVSEIEAMAKTTEALKEQDQKDKLITQANAIVEKTRAMGNMRELDVAGKVSRMKKTLESVRADIASLTAVRQQEAFERAQAEKREANLEQQRQAQEALQAKTADEVAKVREAEAEIIPMLKQLKIREATRALRTLNGEIETKGGLDAQAAALERVNRIEELHKFLVEKTPGFKSSRGWAIDAADAKELTVGGKKITWADIFSSRMDIVGELVNGLVTSEQATKNMRLRERTRMEVNAALCLLMFYNETPSAVDRAKQIATQAAENFPADAEIVHQLLPEFFE